MEGGTRLEGTVRISGAKNAALPILAASLLSGEENIILDIPAIKDVATMVKVLKALGTETERQDKIIKVRTKEVTSYEVPEKLMREMRASSLVLGALIGRVKKAKISYPGGCAIGSRPMDLHFKGLRALGVQIEEKHGFIYAEAKELRGGEIHLDFPSVGATENIIMAAVLAKGVTVIRNPAREPEIIDLQNFLNGLGAIIQGAGTETIRIQGVKELGGTKHTVMPDRIEAGTYMVAAAITHGDVVIENVVCEHIEPVRAKLEEAGVKVLEMGSKIRVIGNGKINPFDIRTLPYPGFPTDMQPQMMALMSIAQGSCIVNEGIFEGRLKHVDELRRMGADIRVEGRVAIINGVKKLTGAAVEATDLRAGPALILAGMAAEGVTEVSGLNHVDRGYENLEEKLSNLGAKIFREKE